MTDTYCIAKYDSRDGDCFGLCLDSRGEPFLYPSLEAAQAAADRFGALGFADTRYEARRYHARPAQVMNRAQWLEHLSKVCDN